ncbi:MAG: protein-disulfide reductase DsbD family protein, partial [Burkholderiales bacterium]
MLGRLARSLAVLVLLSAASADAAPPQTPHVEARLVSEMRSIQPGQPFWVALRLKMEQHWHTYWKNPGDSGLATRIGWTLPQGFQAGEILWPYPNRIEVGPLVNYGYDGEVLLLTQITPPQRPVPGHSRLKARAEWLVCKEICIPGAADLTLSLPLITGTPEFDPIWHQAFIATRERLPGEASDWRLSATAHKGMVALELEPPVALRELYFFAEQEGVIDHAQPQKLSGGEGGYRIEIKTASQAGARLQFLKGVLVADQGLGQAAKAVTVDVPLAVAPAQQGVTLWLALVAAFVGGLILNLMPCVFPIISVKVLGFLQIAQHDPLKVRMHGVAFACGVLLSFWVLAGLLLALRAGGEQIGWGYQLQAPAFVAMLAALFFLLALSLSGVFEFGIGALSLGGNTRRASGYGNSVLSGALATAVASPCTAPFMGAALGYAISQPALVSLAVFSALALGMAAPYVLLSFSPRLLRMLPKPGAWMISFKQFLAFPLYATVVWLTWVLGLQAGMDAVVALLGGLLLLAMAAWVYARWGNIQRRASTRSFAYAVSLVFALGGLYAAWPEGEPAAPDKAVFNTEKLDWQPYTPQRLAESRAAGSPVFVDFTAAWCVTCQANKRLVLHSAAVAQRFRELGVVTLRADWTRYDPVITRALAEFDRNGVPLY